MAVSPALSLCALESWKDCLWQNKGGVIKEKIWINLGIELQPPLSASLCSGFLNSAQAMTGEASLFALQFLDSIFIHMNKSKGKQMKQNTQATTYPTHTNGNKMHPNWFRSYCALQCAQHQCAAAFRLL